MSAIRLVFALLCLLVSTLVLFKVPDLFLWQLKVGATEYGHWFALATLALLLFGRRQSAIDTVSALIILAASARSLSSSVNAVSFANVARSRMGAVFPLPEGARVVRAPYSFVKIWTIGGTKPVAVMSVEYQEVSGSMMNFAFYPADGGDGKNPCLIVIHGGGWDS